MGNSYGSSIAEPSITAQVAKPKCRPGIKKLILKENRSGKKSKIDIEEDCKDVRRAVLSARKGEWRIVWDILGTPTTPRKDYLINCIPETRRWGILHQAVYWRDKKVIQRLLEFKGIDIHLKAKVGMSEIGEACGKTALQIASDFGYTELNDILQSSNGLKDHELDTYILSGFDVHVQQQPLLCITLALYKDSFCSTSKEIKSDKSFHGVLFDIFVNLETSTAKWKKVNETICDSINPVSKQSAIDIGKASTKTEFYTSVIKVYTVEDSWLYAYINRALRRQSVSHYTPAADDLACGPYILMYYILIMFWDELKPEYQTTYRRMKLSKSDLLWYKPGTRFTWTAFTSSSSDENRARSFPSCPSDIGGWNTDDYVEVLFIIDNGQITPWNPRNIACYAAYKESERTYPPGARFAVAGVEDQKTQNKEYRVYLKLLDVHECV